MDLPFLLIAVVLGILEGLTEFLPISSTGHLILAGHVLGFTGERADTFEIFIQLGAILAVAWEFRGSLTELAKRLPSDRSAQHFVLSVGIAFVPLASVGLLLGSWLKAHLFNPTTVAISLIVGGVVMWLLEHFLPPRTASHVEGISLKQALGVGMAQIAALVPGVSRSASTILGGMIAGLDREAATRFSFYLALPTLGVATIYDLVKNLSILNRADALPFAVGLCVAFVSALLVIRIFLRFVRTHDFKPLALYRIGLGVIVLLVL